MGYSIGSADKQGKRGVYGGQQPEPPCTSDILVALSLIRHVLAGYLVRFAGQVRVTAPTPMHGKTPCVLTSCSLTSELATLKKKCKTSAGAGPLGCSCQRVPRVGLSRGYSLPTGRPGRGGFGRLASQVLSGAGGMP